MDKKYCSECDKWKDPLTEFHKNGSRPDGRTAYCKTCRSKNRRDFTQSDEGITLNIAKSIYAEMPTDCQKRVDQLANTFLLNRSYKPGKPNIGIHSARAFIFSLIEWMSKQAP